MYTVAVANECAFLRNAISLICRNHGLSVLFQASNGLILQEYLSSAILFPDIIFMDVYMPGINGIEATAFISQHYPLIKVIALSLYCHEKLIIDMLKCGARGYLTKDTEFEEILVAVQAVMNDEIYIHAKVIEKWKIPANYLKPNPHNKYKTRLLNGREYEFVSYCATDMGYKEIAYKMGLKYKTVDNYRAAVCEKLNIHTKAGLAAYAVKHGLTINR